MGGYILNIDIYKKYLQELREHVEAAEAILVHIDNNELCKVFDAVKDFISGEEAKLLLEQKKAAVQPFFGLQSELPEGQLVLTKYQQELEQLLSKAKSEYEVEQVSKPYRQLVEAMSCQDPVKKMEYIMQLGKVLPVDLLGYTLMQDHVKFPEPSTEEQVIVRKTTQSDNPKVQEKNTADIVVDLNAGMDGTASSGEQAFSENDKEEASVVEKVAVQESDVAVPIEAVEQADVPRSIQENVNTATADKETETADTAEAADTVKPISDELSNFFSGLLLPEDYDYGQLELQGNAKGKKEVGVSQMKSDIRKGGGLKIAIRRAMRHLTEYNVISVGSLQAMIHGSKEEQAANIAEASLQFLQKNGYTERYILDNTDTIYCGSYKLHKLLQQKTAREYLGVEQEKKNSKNKSVIENVQAKHVVAYWAWLVIHSKYGLGLPNTCKIQCIGGHSGAVFQMLIRWNNKDPYDVILGFFDNQLDEGLQQLWQDITKLMRERGQIQRLTLAAIDRSHASTIYEKMRHTPFMKSLLTGKVYYYIYKEKCFFNSEWEEFDPVYSPVKEAKELSNQTIDTEKTNEVLFAQPEKLNDVESVITPTEIKGRAFESEKKASKNFDEMFMSADAKSVATSEYPSPSAVLREDKMVKQPKQSSVLIETQREEILTKVMEAICKKSICSATAYLKYWSQIYEELSLDYQQLAYAVHDPSLTIRYTSEQVCELFSGETSVFRQYLELALACRTFFYNDIEYDYFAHNLQDMAAGTNLMTSALSNVLYQLMNFKKDNRKGIDFYADYRMKDQHNIEAALKQLSSEASDYIANIINKRNSEQKAQKRFIEMKKLIFDPDGDLGAYLQAIYENDASMLPMLKDYLQENILLDEQPLAANNISRQKIEALVDEAWERAAEHIRIVKKNSRLMGSLRNNILTAVTKIADLFCRWCQIAENVSGKGESDGQIAYQKIRNGLLKQIVEVLSALERDNSDSLQEKAGQIILSNCLQELQARLQGTYDPAMERYFYIDFLRMDYVLLDDDYLPDFRHWTYVDEPEVYGKKILSYAEESLPDFSQRMQQIFKEHGDNYLSARLIDVYQQAKGEPSIIQVEGYELEKSIEFAKSNIHSQWRNFCEDLELAQSYGQLDTTKENQKEDILQIVNDCYEYVLRSNNFGVFHQVKEYYEQKIKDDARQRGEVLAGEVKQNRLMIDEQAEDSAELMERLNSIEQMIERQNYTVAEDMLNRWRDQDAEDFDLFTSEDHLKDFMENYDNYYKPVSNSGVSLSRRGHNKDERGAVRLADSWIRSRQSTNTAQIKELLKNLGWRVENVVEDSKQGKDQTFRISLQKALNGKKSNYTHPIAAFGSMAEQDGFRVACLYGRFDKDSLIEKFKELGNAKPTLVFLDFALERSERRHLARKIKSELYGKKPFLLVDRVTISYLMKHYNETKVNRILMCITMPFSVYQPYVWESSNIMPAEMFMGRRKELADIENPNGANIVYGGRQLGKSALLKMAVKDIDHDENHNRAILIDIKGRDYKATALRISQELSDQNFFTSNIETEDWDELARAIRQRLRNDEEPNINYFLLMMDEADAFIESCYDVNFAPFDALKDIQGIGMSRFKFVIAGLRNIIRFDRQKSLSNNSVLTHLTSMTVKPFHASEARELLEVPLYYLGFRFPEDNQHLISMILANANYFPGLIQLYCAKLIEAMSGSDYAKYDQSETPIYEIKEDHIKKVLASQGFRDQIREKFEITLKLGDDKYYYIIALSMAYLYHQHGYYRGYTSEEVLSVVKDFEMHEFDNFTVENMAALMEELRELNVFRKNTEGRYLFARYTFFQMMGNKDEVDAKILAMMEDEA